MLAPRDDDELDRRDGGGREPDCTGNSPNR